MDAELSLMAIGILLNLVVSIGSFVRSRIVMERRLSKIEVLTEILISRSGLHVRDDDVKRNYYREGE